MNRRLKNNGFSLTEVLIAAGILTIGFIMIAGVLPVGVKLTAMSTERTIAAVAADEAFAKIRLTGISDVDQWNKPWTQGGYGTDPNTVSVVFGLDPFYLPDPLFRLYFPDPAAPASAARSFGYPSTNMSPEVKKYFSTAICRYNNFDSEFSKGNPGDDSFLTTVFISRDVAAGAQYFYWDYEYSEYGNDGEFPRPVPMPVIPMQGSRFQNTFLVDTTSYADMKYFITEDSTLLDARTGRIMRVSQRLPLDNNWNTIRIILEEKDFDTNPQMPVNIAPQTERYVWVVPPAKDSLRYPCVGIYQKEVRFNK